MIFRLLTTKDSRYHTYKATSFVIINKKASFIWCCYLPLLSSC
jgi:hypothetical protein